MAECRWHSSPRTRPRNLRPVLRRVEVTKSRLYIYNVVGRWGKLVGKGGVSGVLIVVRVGQRKTV